MAVYGKDFAAVYNDRWSFWGPKMWAVLSELVLQHNPGYKTWLDLCCGTGSLLRLVCEAGFSAVGVDLSPHQLKYARNNAPDAKLVMADIRTFSMPRKFDVVTCMFDSLNYLTEPDDLERAFRCARAHLSDGGVFAFDMNTLEGMQDHWNRTFTIREPERTIVVETSFDEKAVMGCCRVTGFLKEGRFYRRFEEVHLERGYKAREIEAALGRAGFTHAKYDGNMIYEAQNRSDRLLYICRAR